MPAVVRRTVTILFLLGVGAVAGAQTPPIARYVPSAPAPAHVFVLDSAHLLSAATVAALQDSAQALQAETKADVAWVTLPTLGGRAIEEAALYIGRTWRIGTPGNPGDPLRNRGLVILYVPDKTTTAGSNFRIEVGKGLEGTITDSRSRSITTAMRDDLKAKRYDAAYIAGWTVAAALVREDFASHGVKATTAPQAPSKSDSSDAVVALLFVGVVAIFLVVIIASRRRATRAGAVVGVAMAAARPVAGTSAAAAVSTAAGRPTRSSVASWKPWLLQAARLSGVFVMVCSLRPIRIIKSLRLASRVAVRAP
jgi:uncharacterized protein